MSTSTLVLALDPYLIQPGDVLEISVWREDGLQREALVRPDGGLSFPLVGEIGAAGQTVPHFHVHVVPRTRGDGLRGFFWPRRRYGDGEAEVFAARVRGALETLA